MRRPSFMGFTVLSVATTAGRLHIGGGLVQVANDRRKVGIICGIFRLGGALWQACLF